MSADPTGSAVRWRCKARCSVAAPLLAAQGLVRRYAPRGGRRSGPETLAVDGVDLVLDRGESLGVVGSSGAGKSTLGRLLLGVERPDSGGVLLEGSTYDAGPRRLRLARRRRVQAVFQDPLASLNPRLKVGLAIAEPLLAHGLGDRSAREKRVAELLRQVDLDPTVADRYPSELSGGERQRVAIARALSCEPDLLVLDEPVTALDAAHRHGVVELLAALRSDRSLAFLLISHDLATVERLCTRIAVMDRGRLVEIGPVREVLDHPGHAATQALAAAAAALPHPI